MHLFLYILPLLTMITSDAKLKLNLYSGNMLLYPCFIGKGGYLLLGPFDF